MDQKIREYLDWKAGYAPRARVNYPIWLNRFVEVCGNKKLESYTISDIVKYRKWLETRFGTYCIQYAIIIIKNFFSFYKEQNYKCLAPSLVKIPKVKAKSHRAITEREWKRLLAVIPTNEFCALRDSIIVRILWDTGVRVSELCDLDLSQIDESSTSAVIFTKKTGNQRIIVWSKETHKFLLKYMPIRLELENLNGGEALFVGWLSGKGWSMRLTSRTVQRRIKYYVGKAGIKEKITPHSFRHGWAHKRRDQNAPLAFIQRGLGHSNPVSTFIYEQYNDREFERNAKSYL